MTSEVKMTLRLDTLERHRGERARLFLARSAGGGEEVEETSALVELRQDLWSCVKTYTVYVRVSSCSLLYQHKGSLLALEICNTSTTTKT